MYNQGCCMAMIADYIEAQRVGRYFDACNEKVSTFSSGATGRIKY